jgi:hypothetical protein
MEVDDRRTEEVPNCANCVSDDGILCAPLVRLLGQLARLRTKKRDLGDPTGKCREGAQQRLSSLADLWTG